MTKSYSLLPPPAVFYPMVLLEAFLRGGVAGAVRANEDFSRSMFRQGLLLCGTILGVSPFHLSQVRRG